MRRAPEVRKKKQAKQTFSNRSVDATVTIRTSIAGFWRRRGIIG
jgi:hypothetical protein